MEHLKVIEERCVGCGQCTLICEFEALKTEWGETELDRDRCVLCLTCIEYCPVEALVLKEGEES